VNLAVSGDTNNSMRSLLGAQWRNEIKWLGHAWNLSTELAWVHQYGSLTQAINASFEGAADSGFIEHGSGPASNAAQIGIGTRVTLGQRVHGFLRYDGEFGGRVRTNAGSAGLDYRW
jgi:outer membrane autotransporter protein